MIERADRRDALIGVGVGPGDPELVTVRAVRVLRSAGTILVPATDGSASEGLATGGPASGGPASGGLASGGPVGGPTDRAGQSTGRAEATVLAHLDPEQRSRVRRVPFAMREPAGVTPDRLAAWDAAADLVVAALRAGAGPVAFATIGDPSVYSTFSYLARTVVAVRPTTRIEVVPGITAMQDLAARALVPLCEGRETLTLVPATAGLDTLRGALRSADTVVAYKGGRRLPDLLDVVAQEGRLAEAVVGCGLGLAEQVIMPAARAVRDAPASYLTTVLVVGDRKTRGGRL